MCVCAFLMYVYSIIYVSKMCIYICVFLLYVSMYLLHNASLVYK